MGIKDHNSSSSGLVAFIFQSILRLLQFVLALAVAGLYGTDLNNAHKHGIGGDPRWIYAVVTSGLAAVTCIVYMIPFIKSHLAFAWDAVLFILWLTVFGIFGKFYIHEEPKGDAGIQRMKNAVWVDLINMLLWLISAIFGGIIFFTHRGGRSQHTGRASV